MIFSPLKSMSLGGSYMKISLCLLTNINWILSMLTVTSGVWGITAGAWGLVEGELETGEKCLPSLHLSLSPTKNMQQFFDTNISTFCEQGISQIYSNGFYRTRLHRLQSSMLYNTPNKEDIWPLMKHLWFGLCKTDWFLWNLSRLF